MREYFEGLASSPQWMFFLLVRQDGIQGSLQHGFRV